MRRPSRSNIRRGPARPAPTWTDQVPEAVKDERLQRLQALLAEQQQEFAASLVGREIDLLIEKPGREAGQLVGRSPWLQPVIVDEKAGEIGDIVKVRITGAGTATACMPSCRMGMPAIEERRLNATTELKNVARQGPRDMAHIVLTFDNNRLASALYGQFDENLARLEQKLGVDIRSRGNQLTIKGNSVGRRAGAARARPSLRHPAEGRRARRSPTSTARSAWRSPPTTS